ncbi:MAG TPA: segregation/condensation protein A [Pseudothermotoga sp.]|nr:segregation/condensation protein A [Pseudothermotoga sp.]HOK83718.1 segregation/condensation protein A [Pseudothermotoga sp.]HPP69357.1 segregation/condensation protein A [Pseudothermotoga sp.]
MELVFRLQEFEGPLDLLLYLVKRRKISVRQVSVSQLADEFVAYVEQMKRFDLNVTSDFIAMATQLMEMKSKYILPSLTERETKQLAQQEEDLYRRIEMYEKIKELSDQIKERIKDVGARQLVRLPSLPQIEQEKLSKILQAALQELNIRKAVYKIRRQTMTVEQAMNRVLDLLVESTDIALYDVLRIGESRYQVIVYLLAVLELIFFKKVVIFEVDGNLILRRNDLEP